MIAAARAIRDRLRTVAMPPLVAVAGAAELEAVREGTAPDSGSAYVVPYVEVVRPSETIGVHRQSVEISVLIAFCVRTYADATGEAHLDEAEAYHLAIQGALAGWTPDAAVLYPIRYAGTMASHLAGAGAYWLVSRWTTGRIM